MKATKTDDYLNLITKSLTYLYNDDKTCPGITISSLRNGDFYISLSRYDGAFARSRQIIFKDRSNNLENLLKKTAEFIVSQEKNDNPISQLQKILKQPQLIDQGDSWSEE